MRPGRNLGQEFAFGLRHAYAQMAQRIDLQAGVDGGQQAVQAGGRLLAQIEARAHILKRSYRDSAVQMEVNAPESLARVLDPFVVKSRTHRGGAEARRRK